VVCGNTEIPASFISTIWDCNELSTAVSLLLQGYSYTTVARRVHKRTADVKAIKDHIDYFIDLLDQLYQYTQGYPGIIQHTYRSVTFEEPFEVPGLWTIEGLCKCYSNQECYQYVMKYHQSNYLVVLYYYESRYGKLVAYDIFRGVVEWYGVARLIGDIAQFINPNIYLGYTATDMNPTVDICNLDREVFSQIEVAG
jgi:hypothetical protein